jgi:glycosyltransferase involved in cell wall biosynthesis
MKQADSQRVPRLWLVSPIYLDVESFLMLREKLLLAFAHAPLSAGQLKFLLVDDSAGLDPDISRLSKLEDVRVVTPPFNLGHQRAIVFGLRSVSKEIDPDDVIITLDADGEDRPEDLNRMLEPLAADLGDRGRVVLARRVGRRESLSFKLLYAMFKALFVLLTGLVVRTGNFAAFRGWFVQNILFHPSFDLCYSSTLLSLNRPVIFVPCERGERYAGQSRMGYLKLFIHGIRMLMPFLDRIAVRSLIGFSMTFGVGVVLAAVIVFIRLFTDLAIPGWATYMLLLIVLLSFIALGNFIILFALFSQSQNISMGFLDRGRNEGA